jgi:hypothetical protein
MFQIRICDDSTDLNPVVRLISDYHTPVSTAKSTIDHIREHNTVTDDSYRRRHRDNLNPQTGLDNGREGTTHGSNIADKTDTDTIESRLQFQEYRRSSEPIIVTAKDVNVVDPKLEDVLWMQKHPACCSVRVQNAPFQPALELKSRPTIDLLCELPVNVWIFQDEFDRRSGG